MFDLIHITPPSFIPQILANLPLNYHFLVFSSVSLGANIIQRYIPHPNLTPSSLNVINARRKSNQPIAPALLGLTPFFVVSGVAYTFLSHHEEIVHHHLLPTSLYLGVVFAYTVGTIIISHVSEKDFPYWNITFLPLLIGLADVYITPYFRPYCPSWILICREPYISGEYVLGSVLMAFGLSLGVYGGFVVDCIFTMCDYLDINCLTVKKKNTVQNGKTKKR
jgi:ethanolaminephosphotransferase